MGRAFDGARVPHLLLPWQRWETLALSKAWPAIARISSSLANYFDICHETERTLFAQPDSEFSQTEMPVPCPNIVMFSCLWNEKQSFISFLESLSDWFGIFLSIVYLEGHTSSALFKNMRNLRRKREKILMSDNTKVTKGCINHLIDYKSTSALCWVRGGRHGRRSRISTQGLQVLAPQRDTPVIPFTVL